MTVFFVCLFTFNIQLCYNTHFLSPRRSLGPYFTFPLVSTCIVREPVLSETAYTVEFKHFGVTLGNLQAWMFRQMAFLVS